VSGAANLQLQCSAADTEGTGSFRLLLTVWRSAYSGGGNKDLYMNNIK